MTVWIISSDSKGAKFMNSKCPCCGNYTLEEEENNEWNICPVCFWENDKFQLENPDYAGGANKISLNESKENYKEFGACEIWAIKYVRPPNKDEIHSEENNF